MRIARSIGIAAATAAVAGSAAAFAGAGPAASDPAAPSPYNVTGEQYGRALAILKSQGVKAYFGGSRGSVLPQSACLVDQQKVTAGGRMLLELDCTQAAADQIKASGPTGGPTVGSNGITTVTPTPVVPIAGAPGAGAPVAGAPPKIIANPEPASYPGPAVPPSFSGPVSPS